MEMIHMVWTLLMLKTKYFHLFGHYHACWCLGDLSRQGISRHGIDSTGEATYRVAPLWIWSPSAGWYPRYVMKYEYIFYNLYNNPACLELNLHHWNWYHYVSVTYSTQSLYHPPNISLAIITNYPLCIFKYFFKLLNIFINPQKTCLLNSLYLQ